MLIQAHVLCAERKCFLEQFRLSRVSAFPVGSQVHLHQLSVLLQQTGECAWDPDLSEDDSLCTNSLLSLSLKKSTLLSPSTTLTLCSFWAITLRLITSLQPVALLESASLPNTSRVNGEFVLCSFFSVLVFTPKNQSLLFQNDLLFVLSTLYIFASVWPLESLILMVRGEETMRSWLGEPSPA